MNVREHIQQHLRTRLDECECLVVYDPAGRYRDLSLALAEEGVTVVDGSDSTIVGRERATEAWLDLVRSKPGERRLLVYVPVEAPADDRERERDPYAALAVGGGAFPHSDAETYEALALAAKPGHAEQVRALFAGGSSPSFETVDAVDAGGGWPQLRTLLGAESAREITVALLAPDEGQRGRLEADDAWLSEYRQFAGEQLGLAANGRLRKLDSVREELARFVLFSEFALDLPGALPGALATVPQADESQRPLVFAVCDALRTAAPETYVDLARSTEDALDLDALAGSLERLGRRDTFAFEERAYLRRFAEHVRAGDLEAAGSVIEGRRRSLWAHEGDRAPAWGLASRLLDLARLLGADGRSEASAGAAAVVDAYVGGLYRVDAAHRHLESAVQQALGLADELDGAIADVRRRYRDHADALQQQFVAAVREDGWPCEGVLRHTRTFDTVVSPLLEQSGGRVAYLLVDAFRYEMAAEFAERARATETAEEVALEPVAAHLPTITPVGMAALLPRADGRVALGVQGDAIVPTIDGERMRDLNDRLAYARRLFGDRLEVRDLDDLFKARSRKVAPTVQLLLVKTTEIDTTGETQPAALGRTFSAVQQKLVRALRILQEMGFTRVVVATDHGFLWLPDELPGDKVVKPDGAWVLEKERALLGAARSKGTGTASFVPSAVGVKTGAEELVVPESLGTFVTGKPYRHSGLSLQEAVVPAVSIRLAAVAASRSALSVRLSYRGGKTDVVTTRLPLVEVTAEAAELFGPDLVELRLEIEASGKLVGEPSVSAYTDPATGLVRVGAGDTVKVPLRLEDAFEGPFTVRAADPATGVTYAELSLKTDYVD